MGRRRTLLGVLVIVLSACGGDGDATKVATDEVPKTSTTAGTSTSTPTSVATTPGAQPFGPPPASAVPGTGSPATTEDYRFVYAYGDGFGVRLGKVYGAESKNPVA